MITYNHHICNRTFIHIEVLNNNVVNGKLTTSGKIRKYKLTYKVNNN